MVACRCTERPRRRRVLEAWVSPFSLLLNEASALLRVKHREAATLHFDWHTDGGIEPWKAWATLGGMSLTPIASGESGEQALRRLVEELREES